MFRYTDSIFVNYLYKKAILKIMQKFFEKDQLLTKILNP